MYLLHMLEYIFNIKYLLNIQDFLYKCILLTKHFIYFSILTALLIGGMSLHYIEYELN